jgi:tetratricopeptide (TPR) repeat protein
MARVLTILLLLIPLLGFAQNQVRLDSLWLELKNADHDTTKMELLLEISRYYGSHDFSKAAIHAQEAIDLAREKNNIKYEQRAERVLGAIFFNMGNYKSASVHFFEAMKLYEVSKDSVGIFVILNNLGAVHDRLQDYDQALGYYLKGQSLLTRIMMDPKVKANYLTSIYNNIANIYQTKSDFQSARDYYEKSLQLAREVDNKLMQGIALNNLGKLFTSDIPEPVLAYKYLSEALQIRLQLGNKHEIAKSYNQLSAFYQQQENFEEARKNADMSSTLGSEIGSIEVQREAFDHIWQIEKARGNYQDAFDALTQFKKLSDSIQQQHAVSELAKLQLEYDLDKAEQANIIKQKEISAQFIIAIIILTFGLVIAIMLAIVVRSRARQTELKQKNLAQDIEIKNKELTTNVMYLIRKNELINDVAERLLDVKKTIVPDNQKIVHDIILDLQREADNDSWKEFEMRFNQVHGDFYNKLRKLYPALSPADEKLCAFLRLNMSSKEIAAITKQSVKSVEVARARLRKKLDLTNTTSNLVSHLSNL